MSAHVLLNLYNKLGKRDEMRGFTDIKITDVFIIQCKLKIWISILIYIHECVYISLFHLHSIELDDYKALILNLSPVAHDLCLCLQLTWLREYKAFFMLNSAELENYHANQC